MAAPVPKASSGRRNSGVSHLTTDVKNVWYPLLASHELPYRKKEQHARPSRLLGTPLVLFRDEDNAPRCFEDRCPHKCTKLSTGRVRNGKLECFYHGWQFESSTGKVDCIPSLLPDKKIPPQAFTVSFPCVERHKLIWVWVGDVEKASPDHIFDIRQHVLDEDIHFAKQCGMTGPNPTLDASIITSNTIPVPHGIWVENLMDLAHTPWVHDGAFDSIKNAAPTRYTVEPTATGLYATVENLPTEDNHFEGKELRASITWHAPSVVHITTRDVSNITTPRLISLVFFLTPSAPNTTTLTLVFHKNFNFFTDWLQPFFPEALRTRFGAIVPSQDMKVLCGQARNMIEGSSACMCPIQCDEMAVFYRRWHNKAFGEVKRKKKNKETTDTSDTPPPPPDVWWKGWDALMDIEDMDQSACQTTHGADSSGQYEIDMMYTDTPYEFEKRFYALRKPPVYGSRFFRTWGIVAATVALVAAGGAVVVSKQQATR